MDEKIIVSYYGPFLQENIEGMGKALRIRLEQMDTEFSVLQAVFSVYVEMCHNVLHHSSPEAIGKMEIRQENGDIVIESRNYVAKKEKEALESRLKKLNQLNKVQLRQAYLEQRKKEMYAEGRNVGLGLIEMAKRSMGPLEYEFKEKGDSHEFYLGVRIGGKLRCII